VKASAERGLPLPDASTKASQDTADHISQLNDFPSSSYGPEDDINFEDYMSSASSQNVESTAMWSNIFTPKPVPKCSGHNEPAKLWTVNKPGVNKGRIFYLCARYVLAA